MARARRLALVALVGLAVAQTPTPRPTPAPTTARPTTAAPSTARPTTAQPTTAAPSTAAPTTAKPTTSRPTTAEPTAAPSEVPTNVPTGMPTPRPTTAVPTTAAPTLYCRVADLEAQWPLAVSFEVSDGGEGWGDWKGGEFYDIVEDDFVCLGGFERCWSRSDTSKADGLETGALESSEGPDQPWAFVRCDNSGTFRSNQLADNAYPSKVFRLDSPTYPSSLGDWLWPPSCEVALGFAYMMYGADLGTLQVTVTGCWTYDCVDENDYTEVELWSVSGNNPLREWEEAVVHLPPGTSYVSFVATTGSGALSDFALDSIRMFDFHPTSAPTVTPHPSRSPTEFPSGPPTWAPTTFIPPSPAPSVSPRPSPEPSPRPTAAPTSLKSGSKSSSSNDATLYIIIIVSVAAAALLCCCVAFVYRRPRTYTKRPNLDSEDTKEGDAELLLDDPQDSLGGVLDDASGWPADVLDFARRGSEIDQIRKDAQSQSDRGRLRTPPKSPDDWEVYDNQLRGARGPTPRGPPPPPPPPPGPPPPDTPSSTNSRPPSTAKRRASTKVGDFEVTHVIGKGAFGRVLLATKTAGTEHGRAFAVKVLDKEVVRNTGQAAHTRAERQTLASLRHSFVVRLRYAFQSRARLYLVTDFYAGGSLERHLDDAHPTGLGDPRTLYYGAELVCALRHCHAAGVVHRDLKPGNVLLDSRGDVALTDFGLCALGVHEDGAPLRSFCGTVTYMAPELLVGHAYGTSVDWWALGALIFEMASGRPPFEDQNRRRMFYAILHLPPPFPLDFSNELIELLTNLLEKRPERRFGVKRLTTVEEPPSDETPPQRTGLLGRMMGAKSNSDTTTVGVDRDEMHRGEDAIKHQKYFEAIDWQALEARRLPPPWVPALEHAADIAYVPRRVTDRRAASIADEFHDSDAAAQPQTSREARISRQTASLAGDDEEIRRLRSNNAWKDFSFSAPPRGETIAETKRPDPVPTPRAPSNDVVKKGDTAPLVPRPPSPPPPDLVSEDL